ncbi:MAG: phage holin family protein [Acidimicrobiia bacterium]
MQDWTDKGADFVESAVTTLRDRTIVPARTAAKGLVYGTLAAFFVSLALLILAIGAFRLLNVGLPVWASYLVLGGIFVTVGALCWIKR